MIYDHPPEMILNSNVPPAQQMDLCHETLTSLSELLYKDKEVSAGHEIHNNCTLYQQDLPQLPGKKRDGEETNRILSMTIANVSMHQEMHLLLVARQQLLRIKKIPNNRCYETLIVYGNLLYKDKEVTAGVEN